MPSEASSDIDRLRRIARRYEALTVAEGSIVWVVDPQLRPTGPNALWEQYSGQQPGEYAELGWMAAIHPDDRERVQQNAERAVRGGSPLTIEFRIRRADGVYRCHLIRAVPVVEDERVVEWIGTATDIEDARRAADDLTAMGERLLAEQRDLRARLLALTERADSLLSTRDEAGARAAVVDAAERVLPGDAYAVWALDPARGEWRIVYSRGLSPSYAAQQVEGDMVTFAQPLAVDDIDENPLVQMRRDAFRAEGIAALLTLPLPINGERRATLVIYHRSRHSTTETELRVGMALGQIGAAALSNAETNAERDRAKAAAERHALRMAYLADASAALGSLDYEATLRQVAQLTVPRITDWCGIDVVQPDGSVQRLVTAHVDPAKIELAQRLQERYPPDHSAPTGLGNVLRTGVAEFYPFISDETLVGAARDEEHLAILRELGLRSVLIAPLTTRGRMLGAITFVSASAGHPISEDDVTVLTEVARRAALAIDNARLYRDVELANRAKDEFLALLSHELRTPLNAIMGWSHMLRQGLPSDMQQHALDVIGRNAQTQKQLVEDLLDVARIAGGRIDLERAAIDLREVGRTAADSVLPAAQAKGLTMAIETSREPVMVEGDANRLQQVTSNLLSNAIKFTEAGGRITLRVSSASGEATLSVADNGAGIAREFLPHVFERFRQADASLTRNYAGLGLGLWVVKQIIDAHGGKVRAESEGPGAGATVSFTIPNP